MGFLNMKEEILSNEIMLEKIREDRPNQVINEVISFKENQHGFYEVEVDMQTMFFDTKILHTRTVLPYPLSKYHELCDKLQCYFLVGK
jgi:hypothetical protein